MIIVQQWLMNRAILPYLVAPVSVSLIRQLALTMLHYLFLASQPLF